MGEHGSVREVYSNFHNLDSTIWIAILYMHGPLQQKGIDNLSTECLHEDHMPYMQQQRTCICACIQMCVSPVVLRFHEHARNYLSAHVQFSSDSFEHTRFS